MTPFAREGTEVDALRTDRYLEALLAQRDQQPVERSAAGGPATADPALRFAIARLDRSLVRVHPSFRFEERVARRLAEVAASMRVSDAAGAEGSPIPLALPFDPGIDPADPSLAAPGAFAPPGAFPLPAVALPAVPRPLLIGAASAAISIAGAAIVAWRFGRPVDPMTRAVRAAHQLRGPGRATGPARVD